MSDPKTIVREYLEKVVSTGNQALVAQYIAPDAVDHNAGAGDVQGIAGFKRHIAAVRQTYSNFRVIVEAQYVVGDTVISRVTARGINTQDWLGIPASGREITITGINIDRVVNGQIVE